MPAQESHPRPESYVVNWSERQKCFHVETVEEMIFRNRLNFDESVEVDFVPLSFAASSTEAHEAAAKYRQMRGIPLLQDRIPRTR
jgi:hypothetical protein